MLGVQLQVVIMQEVSHKQFHFLSGEESSWARMPSVPECQCIQGACRELDNLASLVLEFDEPIWVEVARIVAPHRRMKMGIDHVCADHSALWNESIGDGTVFHSQSISYHCRRLHQLKMLVARNG